MSASLDPDRTPVVVAGGQAISRDLTLGPIELAVEAALTALGAAGGLAAAIERLTLVSILSRRAGVAPASEVAGLSGLKDVAAEVSSIGGNTPQALVERAAADIAMGRLQATLIVGAEAVRSGRLRAGGKEAGAAKKPAPAPAEPDPVVGTNRQDLSDEERAAGLFIPVQVYPLFESALAARAGRSAAEQREHLGHLMAPFTEVAARHPYAWFQQARTPEEISTPSPENRLVVEPYTKTMVAFLGGAQGAALAVTSLSVARRLGLDDGCMYVWGAASANEVWYPVNRPDLGRAAGLEAAAHAALATAQRAIDDMDAFDVYSCFPSAVQMGATALGLEYDVARPETVGRLTVTGGLPYFGGPGNNYVSHSIATMLDVLRRPGHDLGLVTGVGWYLTKHSVGVYGSEPPPRPYAPTGTAPAQARIDATAIPHVPAGEALDAEATVVASAVLYDRNANPEATPVIATLDDGRRVVARAGDGAGLGSLVGGRVHVESAAGATAPPCYQVLETPLTSKEH